MAEIISFSKARKKTTKLKKEQKAEENRIKFGRTKAEKKLQQNKQNKNNKDLDDHQLDR